MNQFLAAKHGKPDFILFLEEEISCHHEWEIQRSSGLQSRYSAAHRCPLKNKWRVFLRWLHLGLVARWQPQVLASGSLEGQGISFPGASFMLQASCFKQTSLHAPSARMVSHKPIPTSIIGRKKGFPWLVQTTQDLPWILGRVTPPLQSYKIGV